VNSRFRKYISALVAVVILISSNGIVLATHSCFSKAETKVSLFSHKGCCSQKKKNCHSTTHSSEKKISSNCCRLTISYHKSDVNSIVKHAFSTELNFFPVQNIHASLFSPDFFYSTFYLNKVPPKLSGRTLLSSISTLQI
jgi:hypothetical protein